MASLIVSMMVATLLEKAGHSALAFSSVYHSPVFISAWATVAILGVVRMISVKMQSRPTVLCIHLAFLLILAGALVTHLSSCEGKIHLRIGETAEEFLTEPDDKTMKLPFSVTLSDFRVIRSHGGSAIDYVSTVSADGKMVEIAMNRILKEDGFRIFQAGYDEDEGGAWLSVTHDPYGTAISYAGYWLLIAGMALFFFDRKSRFREALRRISKGISGPLVYIAVFLSCSMTAVASPKVLPEYIAEEYGRLYVNYGGRICQVQTMARDYVLKVYGKTSVEGYSAEQIFTGWLLYYDSWKDYPVKCRKGERGGPKELEKRQVITDIAGGRDLKIFPVSGPDGRLVWYASASRLPHEIESDKWTFIRSVNSLIGEYAWHGQWDDVRNVISKISKYQIDTASGTLPAPTSVRAERIYNAIGRPFLPAMISLSAGIILFLLLSSGFGVNHSGVNYNVFCNVVLATLLSGGAYLSVVLALRWFISGHIPMSNGYEMMLIIAWASLVLSSVFGKRNNIMYCFGFLLAGFSMLVASLGQASPAIGTLMPVLSSPLLSIHVGCMMISYTLLGLLAINGLFGIVRHKDYSAAGETAEYGIVILYPALFFLTAGTFIGAIWANVSWGNYWSWDPKETWALITVLVYSAAVHSRSIKCLSKPLNFNIFCFLAFLCVIITYFGVNFFLGGAHSYA